jgi:phosphonate metabolism-associated iron-containing alcohol dehydrogenase
MWRYHNPVDVTFGLGAVERLGEAVAGRPYALVTYPDRAFDALVEHVEHLAGPAALVIRDVAPNPDFVGLEANCASYGAASTVPRVIVAVGGGSVLDAAKVLAAANGDFTTVRGYLVSGQNGHAPPATPIIAVPTTSGTGSEVTSWATVWDSSAKKKYSLARPDLYPERALVDPLLTLGAPRGLTIATGLDALSHALESLWNVNANPVSGALAVRAARSVLEVLPALAEDLGNGTLRARMAQASLFAGLAFSNTKTALAHALSYHFTLHHGVPHGIACSFSLPLVMRSVIGCTADCDAGLRAIFGDDLTAGIGQLERFLDRLGVNRAASSYGVPEAEWQQLIDAALAGERGRNFIGRRAALA